MRKNIVLSPKSPRVPFDACGSNGTIVESINLSYKSHQMGNIVYKNYPVQTHTGLKDSNDTQ